MIFLISLGLTAILIAIGSGFIKKHATICYGIALFITCASVAITATKSYTAFPDWIQTYIWSLFSRGALATALFAVVMITGALPNGSYLMKKLMPIRAELSIIACILIGVHNIFYGVRFVKMMVYMPQNIAGTQVAALIFTIIMLLLMIPLMITSFASVRKKMPAKLWKKIQRSAYVFYGLIYLHVMVLMIPSARAGIQGYTLNILVYSFVFLGYAGLRARKAWKKAQPNWRSNFIPPIAACFALLLVCGMIFVGTEKTPPVNQGNKDVVTAMNNEGAEVDDTILPTESTSSVIASDIKDSDFSELKEEVEKEKTPVSSNEAASQPTGGENPSVLANSNETGTASENKEETTEVLQKTYVYKDGTYAGSGKGFAGNISVKVTIESDVIKEISVVSSSDDEPYFSNSKAVISRVISSQSTGVDTVSGATFSSEGIIEAVKNALSDAKK